MDASCHIYNSETHAYDYLTGQVIPRGELAYPHWVGVRIVEGTVPWPYKLEYRTAPFRAKDLDEARLMKPECARFEELHAVRGANP